MSNFNMPRWADRVTQLCMGSAAVFAMGAMLGAIVGWVTGKNNMLFGGGATIAYALAFGGWAWLIYRKKPMARWYWPQLFTLTVHLLVPAAGFGLAIVTAILGFGEGAELVGQAMGGVIVVSWPVTIIWLVVAAIFGKGVEVVSEDILDREFTEQ